MDQTVSQPEIATLDNAPFFKRLLVNPPGRYNHGFDTISLRQKLILVFFLLRQRKECVAWMCPTSVYRMSVTQNSSRLTFLW